jgi:hypothetical protein
MEGARKWFSENITMFLKFLLSTSSKLQFKHKVYGLNWLLGS